MTPTPRRERDWFGTFFGIALAVVIAGVILYLLAACAASNID
jgi:hypothetical protein